MKNKMTSNCHFAERNDVLGSAHENENHSKASPLNIPHGEHGHIINKSTPVSVKKTRVHN